MKEIQTLPMEHYIDLMHNNKPFSFSRFGDGEVLCMFNDGILHENCDGSEFLPGLIEPMKQIFRNQYEYHHCLLNCSFWLNGDKFKNFIEETCPEMPFYDGDIWRSHTKLPVIISAINPHRPCFVGGAHIANVKSIHGMDDIEFIEVPPTDAFKKIDHIFEEIKLKHANGTRMFCFSAGYSTKILIDNLFPVIGHNTFMIDFGSIFDPYCGRLSRREHAQAGFQTYQPYTLYKLK